MKTTKESHQGVDICEQPNEGSGETNSSPMEWLVRDLCLQSYADEPHDA
jgi:hypothetical protein